MVNVRKMEFRDIKKVVELEEKYLLESLGEKLLASELSEKNNGVSFYVIENDDVVIGYIGRYYFFQEAEVLNFVVDESYQRQGYGQKLFDKMVKDMKDVKKITLEVRASNIKGINFYTKNGFKQVGVRKKYYKNGEDALLLLKEFI
ncbi:MAG TPA: ribosomal-protein-alanine N-acetyltransferase [Acholeplasmatales bacterium]|jgi:ribosomal-protein-alanine N-acetyltransferase|nr:ribosomal protein S18-alanine N-acetyltransferase [Bacilli bacterium]HCX07626.1 ribosomal-protein-alanine N-acetyltransferase [Acholeplasmatales bacterium]